jgi:hypothetical protein
MPAVLDILEARHRLEKTLVCWHMFRQLRNPERKFTRLMWIMRSKTTIRLLSSLAAKQCMQTCLYKLVPFATNRLRDIDRVN